jgi:heme oxygenase
MDVLQYLRETTRSQHDAIEGQVDLLRPDLTLNEYRHLLERFYGFYVPLEGALARAADWDQLGFSLVDRRKAERLAQDLRHFGHTAAELQALPRCSELPQLEALGAALGCLYVLEGATLGGQLISRHVMPRFGLTAAAGCAFFTSYGGEVGRKWRALGQFLRAQLQSEAEAQQAAEAACDTFAKLGSWIARGHGRQ